jgi:epoxide hydrolase
MTVFEFLDVVEPLSNPADPSGIAFDFVIPSIPGMGLSGPTSGTGYTGTTAGRLSRPR